MGVGSSFDLKIKLSSFSSFPSQITGASKAQLVSACWCVAALWPHCWSQGFSYFFVAPSGMCWRGLGPSHTESLEVSTFHVPSFLILLVLRKAEGMVRHFGMLSLVAPPPHCKKPLHTLALLNKSSGLFWHTPSLFICYPNV